MAIPKKGTRNIVVQDETYRWLIRRKVTYTQSAYGTGFLHVAIDHNENPGTTLLIITDRQHPKDCVTKKVIPVTPGDVASWIIQAKTLGWKPMQKGSPIHVVIVNGEMSLR